MIRTFITTRLDSMRCFVRSTFPPNDVMVTNFSVLETSSSSMSDEFRWRSGFEVNDYVGNQAVDRL